MPAFITSSLTSSSLFLTLHHLHHLLFLHNFITQLISPGFSNLLTFGFFGVVLAFWVTIFVNWAVGFSIEKRSDEYYYDPNYGYYCEYT